MGTVIDVNWLLLTMTAIFDMQDKILQIKTVINSWSSYHGILD